MSLKFERLGVLLGKHSASFVHKIRQMQIHTMVVFDLGDLLPRPWLLHLSTY